MILEARALSMSNGGRTVLERVDLGVDAGEMVAVVGPNGSGKSTLLRGLGRLQRLQAGSVLLEGQPLTALSSRAVARRLAVLPQSPSAALDLTVEELVWRGRYPHQGLFLRANDGDRRVVQEAISACDLGDLAARSLGELSGGERQRAWLAMALAQRPRVLLLDEPTSALDFQHQLDVMEILTGLKGGGMAIVAVLHDLVLAARYADRVLALYGGRVAFSGPPATVLTPGALERVFAVRMAVLADPAGGGPLPVPLAPIAGAGSSLPG